MNTISHQCFVRAILAQAAFFPVYFYCDSVAERGVLATQAISEEMEVCGRVWERFQESSDIPPSIHIIDSQASAFQQSADLGICGPTFCLVCHLQSKGTIAVEIMNKGQEIWQGRILYSRECRLCEYASLDIKYD